jgi:polysaccharide biosynthesis protein PslH
MQDRSLRLVVICPEPPFPARHGGRVDMLRRIEAFRSAGVRVALVCWTNDHAGEFPEPISEVLRHIADEVFVFPLIAFTKRLALMATWPTWLAERVLSTEQIDVLSKQLDGFSPDAVWLDGISGGALAKTLTQRYAIPLYYRSHNMEADYVRMLYHRMPEFNREKLAQLFNVLHMRRFERSLHRKCKRVYDISQLDMSVWRHLGFNNNCWLPPVVDSGMLQLEAQNESGQDYHVGYVGNLYAPNNVEGLLWFSKSVMPILKEEIRDIRVFWAGSKPTTAVLNAAKESGIEVHPDPEDIRSWIARARVLINPVFAGSGVNIKSVEMLFAPGRLVSTRQGVQGLPPNVVACFDVNDSPEGFAVAVKAGLKGEQDEQTQICRHQAHKLFSPEVIGLVVDQIRSDLDSMRGEKS